MARLIDNQIWNARSFSSLSSEDKLLFLYLETSPETNYYGVFVLPNDQIISARTGLATNKIKSSLEELQIKGKIAMVGDYIIIFDYFDRQKNNNSEKTKKGLDNFEKSLKIEVLEVWRNGKTSSLDTPFIPDTSPHEESKVNKSKEKENESKVNNKLLSFDNFWNLYEKKGNRKKSLQYFLKLDEETIQLILTKVPGYVLATPDSQYRKNGETYLYGECWNDTLPVKPKDKTLTPMQQQNSSINESWATDEPWEGLELEDGTFVIPS